MEHVGGRTIIGLRLESMALLGLVVAAVLVRFNGLAWDQGLMLHPDERNLATAAASLRFPDGLVPTFHAYNGLSLYLPRLLTEALRWIGLMPASGVPEIALASRILSASFSLAAAFLFYRCALLLFDEWWALFTLALAIFTPGFIQAAHFGTTESALLFFLMLTIYISMVQLKTGASIMKCGLGFGLAIGLALGFKTTAASFAIVPLVAALVEYRHTRQPQKLLVLPIAGVLAVLLILLTTPQIVLDTSAYVKTMQFEGGVVRGIVDVFWTYQFQNAIPVAFELRQLPWLAGILPACAAILGIGALVWRLWRGRPDALPMLPLLIFSLVYAAIIFSWHAKFVRYLVPLLPLIILATALLCRLVWQRRPQAGTVISGIIAYTLVVQGLLQASLYSREDSRLAAWHYLQQAARRGDGLAVEPVEVGLPFPGREDLALQVNVLPLLDPSSQHKIQNISIQLEKSAWLVISSRRHYLVLPGLKQRYPEMCGYYDALWNGELGFAVAHSFRRRPQGVFSFLDPSMIAEETLSVFDSPTVFILRKEETLTAAEIADRIVRAKGKCN